MRLAVTIAGLHAQRLIDAAEDGTVIAVFARSLYVRDNAGRIACFGGPSLGKGPLNALCDTWPDGQTVPANAGARWQSGVLRLGDSIGLDVASTAPWHPVRPKQREGLALGLKQLTAIPARGLGLMIPTLVSDAARPSGDRFQMAAFEGVLALAQWLSTPTDQPPETMARLIGLGPGLTPAGDDALGGALVALRTFNSEAAADRLAVWSLARARGATSDISYAHLAAAAEGEGAAALHDTLAALAGDREELTDAVARLDRIGHSSGWDALAGAVAALTTL